MYTMRFLDIFLITYLVTGKINYKFFFEVWDRTLLSIELKYRLCNRLWSKSNAMYSNSSRYNREKIFCLISMFFSLLLLSLLCLHLDQIDFPVHPRLCHRYIIRTHPGDSVWAYICMANLASGRRFCDVLDLRENEQSFFGASRTGVCMFVRVKDTTNELKRLSSFKCVRKINFPSRIGWAYHFNKLHWLEMKWRRKCFAWYAWYIFYCSLKGSLFFIVNLNSGKIRLHVKHELHGGVHNNNAFVTYWTLQM